VRAAGGARAVKVLSVREYNALRAIEAPGNPTGDYGKEEAHRLLALGYVAAVDSRPCRCGKVHKIVRLTPSGLLAMRCYEALHTHPELGT
jgi:hypothetical protein